MRIFIIKLLINLGVIKLTELNMRFRKQFISDKARKKRADARNCKRIYRDGIVHPSYPPHISKTMYHHGCWVSYYDKNSKTVSVLHFDTQKSAAKFLADMTGENITRNDVYNAIRWQKGRLGWGTRTIAMVSYDKP